ncbi:nuclear protein MDM1 isoform X2 [Colossoma macropomum]|uniref:nuclear protein MDM1 isoform X2 n=1 Tax=Colossoma macropomum TaxID=42526 RepID=UPI0018647837|nr:nuclear protein MDM1 isoform X2 [Colossoma macropomum]
MTVRFKGISEYQNKYRTRPRRVKSASPQRRMRLAGVRSDQLGISREPQFQSKRRVPFYSPQVPTSLQWGNSAVSQRQQDLTRPGSPPAVVHVARTSSAEKIETPLAPRVSKPSRAPKTIQHQEEVQSAPSADQEKQEHPSNGINHALKKKAGLRSERQRNGRQSSEYQRQFLWKTPVAESPLLAAQQMLYSSNKSIPPFKSNPVEMESEYKRSFKGSPPLRPPRLRRDMELNEVPQFQRENISPEKSKRKKRREQRLSKKSRPKEETHPEPQPLQQEVRAACEQKDVSPKVMRKMKTEYTSNFRSPLQYCYRDGAWVRSRAVGEEVCDLREKAEAYRRRAWGTHFSRQHLSQILSEQNCLWEASSASSSSTLTEQDSQSPNSPIIEALDLARVDSVRESSSPGASVSLSTSRRSSFEGVGLSNGPTLPVQRKLAWEEEAHPCERGVAEIKQQREESPIQQPKESDEEEDMNEHSEDKREKVRVPEREPSSPSVGSRCFTDEGRLPTPTLKTMLTAQRTHHDRTTPTTGGAMLVSPPKTKNSSRTSRRSEAPLGKAHSPYKHLNHSSPPRAHSKAENGSLPRSSPAAGMATVDPLPLREDTWAEDSPEPFSKPKTVRTPQKRAISARLIANSSPHANRIQGTLRNPEFQHNGNLGLHRPDQFVFPSSDSGVSDDDDRLSQISSRSAASCSMASQVLDRAQRRKEDFWGKS